MKRFLTGLTLLGCLALTAPGTIGAQDATPAASPVSIESIDPANFVKGVTNPYFPLVPNTVFIFEGESEGLPTRNEVTVTSEVKTILGIECIVVRDLAFEDGEVIEDTLDWYAQDKEGNVWYFGEASQSIEDGVVKSTAGSWEAGVDGASPGLIMPANPTPGESYYQEYYPGEAEDQARVLTVTDAITIGLGEYQDVVTTSEWTNLDPEIEEHKSYAKGVGLILAVAVRGENERLELIEIRPGS
jgi:hypothetical protein